MKAIALEPDSPYTRGRQGYLALATGAFSEALPHFEYATTNDESMSWKFGFAFAKFAIENTEDAKHTIVTLLSTAENDERTDALRWLDRIAGLKPELEIKIQEFRNSWK